MKLVFQIALGVFIGALASQYAFEQWRSYEAQQAAEIEQKERAEAGIQEGTRMTGFRFAASLRPE